MLLLLCVCVFLSAGWLAGWLSVLLAEYMGEETDEEVNILRAVYDEAKELEANYKAQAVR